MKAILVEGDPQNPQLVWGDAPDPVPAAGEVLISVKAAGVNRADLLQARGGYAPPTGASPILGLEVAGVVESANGMEGWRVGDRVCALVPGGGYAEKAAVDARVLMPLSAGWTFVQGAAVPEVWFTAFVNLFFEGGLREGETVLIHAGASGVGTAAIQLALDAGARVFVTVGSPEKAAFCRGLGAHRAIDYKTEDFVEEALRASGQHGVDLIVDCVGGPYLAKNISVLARFGRLVLIGLLGGPRGEVNLGAVLTKRLRLIGSTLRSRSRDEHAAITRQFRSHAWEKLERGEMRVIIDKTFPIEQAAEAHAYVADNRNTGKVILTLE